MIKMYLFLLILFFAIPQNIFADANEDIVFAAREGNLQKIKKALSVGASINAVDDFDMEKSLLMIATERGDYEIVRFLVSKGANTNYQTTLNLCALVTGARKGHLKIVKYLIENGANVNIKGNADDTALIEVDAYLDHTFRGVVTEIANSAVTTGVSADQVTTFDVKIFILPESYSDLMDQKGNNPFRPGMSTTVDIQTETKYDIITVPIQAVTTRTDTTEVAVTLADEEEKTIVFASDGTYALAREVKTGIQDNNYIEILSGIDENTDVVYAPYSAISDKLADSTLIEILPREELFEIEN